MQICFTAIGRKELEKSLEIIRQRTSARDESKESVARAVEILEQWVEMTVTMRDELARQVEDEAV